ncbi:prephenate dehydratase [Kiritimatiellaeota bacterium B1221]|nr:prephenate dehydratase [Kiritimatiellaeota bacterium B1221]
MSTFEEYRNRIDDLDSEIVARLNERIRCAMGIGRLKQASNAPVYVPAREMQVFEKVMALNEGPLSDAHVRAIYREIMSAAISLELESAIAFLGPLTTYTHQAALSKFGQSLRYVPCETIEQIFEEVEKGNAQYGVVPIENSIEGGVTSAQDRLTRTPLKITAEIYLPIHHCLIVQPGVTTPKRIFSKPEALGQCRTWLQRNFPQAELCPSRSTAGASEAVLADPENAAIASRLTAEHFKLEVLQEGIQDISGNTTRFLVLGKEYGPPSGKDKTSVFFGVRHKTGALFHALEPLHRAGVNLLKIESRPSKQRAWEYTFFVDVEGHAEDPEVRSVLDELADQCQEFTILGSYPIAFRS